MCRQAIWPEGVSYQNFSWLHGRSRPIRAHACRQGREKTNRIYRRHKQYTVCACSAGTSEYSATISAVPLDVAADAGLHRRHGLPRKDGIQSCTQVLASNRCALPPRPSAIKLAVVLESTLSAEDVESWSALRLVCLHTTPTFTAAIGTPPLGAIRSIWLAALCFMAGKCQGWEMPTRQVGRCHADVPTLQWSISRDVH
jgi:hypothetical protein